MLVKAIKRLKDKGQITEEVQNKIDVLFLAGKISEDDYLTTIDKTGHHINKIDDRTFEIVEDDDVPENDGTDYIKPKKYIEGMEVTTGLWYTDGDDVWECIKDGIPEDFSDKQYFDIID